ncbi:MAG: LPS assembly lipoprotein LptE [marine benthic group bacterium]|nr:LPS assembly lipoprotein LptE [Gemmatimonadota bacterium]
MRFRTRTEVLSTGLVALAAVAALSGCNYTFSGGGGLPSHVETIYVAPVDNQTTQFALTEPVTQELLDAATGRLGAQLGPEESADATVLTTLSRYDDTAVNFASQEQVGAEVFQRRIRLSARVEIIDNTRNEIIWSGGSVTGIGEYTPETELETRGQELAIKDLVQKIVDGAQSQW